MNIIQANSREVTSVEKTFAVEHDCVMGQQGREGLLCRAVVSGRRPARAESWEDEKFAR